MTLIIDNDSLALQLKFISNICLHPVYIQKKTTKKTMLHKKLKGALWPLSRYHR